MGILTEEKKCFLDVNECEDEKIKTGCPYGCINTIGSYFCAKNSNVTLSDQPVEDYEEEDYGDDDEEEEDYETDEDDYKDEKENDISESKKEYNGVENVPELNFDKVDEALEINKNVIQNKSDEISNNNTDEYDDEDYDDEEEEDYEEETEKPFTIVDTLPTTTRTTEDIVTTTESSEDYEETTETTQTEPPTTERAIDEDDDYDDEDNDDDYDFSEHHNRCIEGYEMNVNGDCIDVDECSAGTASCSHDCENIEGGYNCLCPPGFELELPDFHNCQDTNECISNPCAYKCINEVGTFHCECPEGYLLLRNNSCIKITCPHHQPPVDGICVCPKGYTRAGDGVMCDDVNECNQNNHGCSHLCINTEGSYSCSCYGGYVLEDDGRTCSDVNECLKGVCSQKCENTNGSFKCFCEKG